MPHHGSPLDPAVLREKLIELLPGSRDGLVEFLRQVRPESIAEVLRNYSEGDTVRIFEALDPGLRAEVIDETDETSQESLTRLLPSSVMVEVLEAMPPDEAADLVKDTDERQREALLAQLPDQSAGEIRELLQYDPESAGGIMTSDFVTVDSRATARDVLVVLQDIIDTEVVSYVYVVDHSGVLEGVISIREILRASADDVVGDFMARGLITAHVNDDQEAVANVARKFNLHSIPVVDNNGRIVGVATIDDLIDVLTEEADEDFSRFAGTEAGFTTPQPVLRRALARIPWLLLPGISGFVVATFFESEAQKDILIWAFIPLVMGVSGASGTQASTILVRGMATGEIDAASRVSVLLQELLIGATVALTIALVSGLALGGAAAAGWLQVPAAVPIAVGIGVLCGILIATAAGVFLPFLFRVFAIDPALAAGPFITSLIDVLAALAFLGIGNALIHG